jgi:hypothetical protein
MPLSTRRSPLHALRRSGLFGSSGLNPFIVGEFTPHDGRYLRRYAADFVIHDYINFISRRNPAGKSYWEGYNDGPRKHSFAHCQVQWVHGVSRPAGNASQTPTPPTSAGRPARGCNPTNTHRGSHDQRRERNVPTDDRGDPKARRYHARKAQQQALEIIARAHEGNPTGDETIRFMSDEDEDEDNDT